MVRASALLFQYQRQFNKDGQIIANEDDYFVACQAMEPPLGEQLAGAISNAAEKFYDCLELAFGTNEFTVPEALNDPRVTLSQSQVYDKVRELSNSKCLKHVDSKGKTKIWKCDGKPNEPQRGQSVGTVSTDQEKRRRSQV
jgi:hypothetical protein